MIATAPAANLPIDPHIADRMERHRRFYKPRERARSLVWFKEHVRNTDGRPYSHDAYPHLGAPGGPCDAMDDPLVRRIWLQFASRLGKTFFGQASLMKKTDCNPGPLMFASASQTSATDVIERTYMMFDNSPKVSGQLPPIRWRRKDMMRFDACKCPVAWARSVATLADKEVEWGHANEIDKWEHLTTSKEAHPLKLFTDRFKNRPHHKALFESTPAQKGSSKIEAGRLGSTNCKLYVPCPHCERYQTLKMKSEDGTYRLRWKVQEGGRSDKDMARRTAVYHCEHCDEQISDFHRPKMMRLGVWCPEGCKINDKEAQKAAKLCSKGGDGDGLADEYEWVGWENAAWIEGTPARDGPDAGYQLSSLYALALTWGDIAAEFVSCKDKPQELRNFINQWLAETWEVIRRKQTWEKFATQIIVPDRPRAIVPVWASMLTCGIDRQEEDGERLPWVIDAWGPANQVATIAYGEIETLAAIQSDLLAMHWHHEDGGEPLHVAMTLMDSGFKPTTADNVVGVYDFVAEMQKKGFSIAPVKGSSTAMDVDYRVSVLGPRTSSPGTKLVFVDTTRTQLWIENQIRNPEDLYFLHAGSILEHQDFCEQLLNDAPVDKLDKSNNQSESWERISATIPNDFRDCRRYSYIAKLIHTRGREVKTRKVATEAKRKPRSAVVSAGKQKGGGRW